MKIKVTKYEELDNYVAAFTNRHLGLLIIIGPPGTQKSTVVKTAVKTAGDESARVMEGSVTAFGLYCELYLYKDQPFVIDDVDALYNDPAAVRLLKTLCQTDESKAVSWHTAAAHLDRRDIPREFSTTSPVCIIANTWSKHLNPNIAAIVDRGLMIDFEPSNTEIHTRADSFVTDREIYDFIGTFLRHIKLSMRHYKVAAELKAAGIDWRAALVETWGINPALVAISDFLHDKSYKREADRIKAWIAKTGGSRAYYFKLKKQLKEVA